ncbi:hypothetical protein BIY23_04590 [Wolbachia pipientis]|uniref:Uncharacterized protein n=1 Tax=Wolbachia pipientis TaxID=955 RepID=A0A1E7QK72_WOLPI|nr:ankyrin repeat domain-containing protein [Wolbachia pipientis]OEY86875.1 hypothetical protein BIY23_04590 [Wolbachia pipientis]
MYDKNVLNFAAQIGCSNITKILFEYLNANEKDLFYAAKCGNLGIVQAILNKEVNNYNLNCALRYAASYCNIEVTEYLLKNGACNGNTALHDAAEYGHAEIVQLLIPKAEKTDI